MQLEEENGNWQELEASIPDYLADPGQPASALQGVKAPDRPRRPSAAPPSAPEGSQRAAMTRSAPNFDNNPPNSTYSTTPTS